MSKTFDEKKARALVASLPSILHALDECGLHTAARQMDETMRVAGLELSGLLSQNAKKPSSRNEIVWSTCEQLGSDLIREMTAEEIQDIISQRGGGRPPLRTIRNARQKILGGTKLRRKVSGLSFNYKN